MVDEGVNCCEVRIDERCCDNVVVLALDVLKLLMLVFNDDCCKLLLLLLILVLLLVL